MSVNANPQEVIASEDVVVHDDNLNIDRKLFAGQPVPPDLVDAYHEKTGKGKAAAEESSGRGKGKAAESGGGS